MSWVKLDDGFHRNTKQLSMSDGAFRLYVCSLSYCAQEHEATGYLSDQQALTLRRSLGKSQKAIEELVKLNAWEPATGGYLIHDYDEYLEKGSRDRVRKHRDLKRYGNADVTLQGGYGNEGGNVTKALLARDGYPVPVPVPVPVKGFSPKARLGNKAREEAADDLPTESPEVVAYGECFIRHGRVPSAVDLEVLRRIPYEFDRLSHTVVLDAIEEVATKFEARDKPMPSAKYLIGKLAQMQVKASEAGARPQSQFTGGFTRLSDLLPGGTAT